MGQLNWVTYVLFLFALRYCRRIMLCFKMRDNSLVIISHKKWLDAIFLSYYFVYVRVVAVLFFRWNAFTFCRFANYSDYCRGNFEIEFAVMFLHFSCILSYIARYISLKSGCCLRRVCTMYISVIRVFVVDLLESHQNHVCRPRLCQLQCYVLLFRN